jgi:DNA primase
VYIGGVGIRNMNDISVFDFIKQNLPILDVVREYVSMRHLGNYWKGSCPFHTETDASFTISPDKGIFYCFGCHAGGDVIAFFAKAEQLTQFEAVQAIIDRFKIVVPPEILKKSPSKKKEHEGKDDYFYLCDEVAQWAHKQLLHDRAALEYLKNRGIETSEITYFLIGYFPGGLRAIDHFIKTMSRQNILTKDLLESGFISQGRSGMYSPFEERIIFPIRDSFSRCVGFGGRIFKASDERAKYYNSKESQWFNKGKVLFGLDLAKKEMQKQEVGFLVEGYIDALTMVKHGYANTVATLGTACTHDHLKTLSRYIKKVYVVYDGDAAGQKAILRLTELCWHVNMELSVIQLPEKEDPASFLYKGGDMHQLILKAQDIFTFFITTRGSEFFTLSLVSKLQAAQKIIEIIATNRDSFKRDVLLQEAASAMQIPFSSLKLLLADWISGKKREIRNVKADEACNTDDSSLQSPLDIPWLEAKIVACIINSIIYDTPYELDEEIHSCLSPHARSILTFVQEVAVALPAHRRFQGLLERLSEEEKQWVMHTCLGDDDASRATFDQLRALFCKQHWKNKVRDLKIKLLHATQEHDDVKVTLLLEQMTHLKKEMQDKGLV